MIVLEGGASTQGQVLIEGKSAAALEETIVTIDQGTEADHMKSKMMLGRIALEMVIGLQASEQTTTTGIRILMMTVDVLRERTVIMKMVDLVEITIEKIVMMMTDGDPARIVTTK